MTLLATLRHWFRPPPSGLAVPAIRAQASTASGAGAVYEGATQTRRAAGWPAPTIGANDGVLPSLATLRARSRAAVRNDGYARAAIDRLVSNVVGAGIVPQSQAPTEAYRGTVQQAWLRWTDEADATGRLDLYGVQAQAVRGWLESGEVFIRLRTRRPEDGLSVPLQLELLDPELVPEHHTTVTPEGHAIRAGIEFDRIGRRVAYHVYRRRPADLQDLGTGELVRLPVSDPDGFVRERVLHLYEPLRPGQLRGVPQLTQALLRLRDLDLFADATLLRQQLANMFVGFHIPPAAGMDPATDVLGQPITRDAAGRGVVGLEPGLWQELGPGEEVKFSDPPEATGYAEFTRAQLMAASVACGVPMPLLTNDVQDLSDRALRVVLDEFRRRVAQWQAHIVVYQLCRPVWAAWFSHAVLGGAIPLPPTDDPGWSAVEWIPPAWPWLHVVQDVEAERAMVRAGFKSRTQVAKERGYDIEQLDREMAADHARADALGLTLDSDPRKTRIGGGVAEPPTPEGGR